jgi:uroporphyrinogen decarboxylase
MDCIGNFSQLLAYLSGEAPATRVHLADLLIDDPILQQYTEQVLQQPWVERNDDPKAYWKNYVDCYCHMGFDYIPVHFWIQNTFTGFPTPKTWIAHDCGIITTQAEYEAFPWEELAVDYSCLETVSALMPPNMKIVVVTGDLQDLMDVIVGTTAFLLMIYDDPDLLRTIIERWFAIKLELFETVVKHAAVGAIWTCADFGSKSDTLFSPLFITENLFPWYRKFAQTAHRAHKPYWFHSCGNLYTHQVMDELINTVGIDAFHSFQDTILPVAQFVQTYGKSVATLGGVDLDALCLLPEAELRLYIRGILDACIPLGRYALGTGNSVASYVPFKNWLILLEEAHNYVLAGHPNHTT